MLLPLDDSDDSFANAKRAFDFWAGMFGLIVE